MSNNKGLGKGLGALISLFDEDMEELDASKKPQKQNTSAPAKINAARPRLFVVNARDTFGRLEIRGAKATQGVRSLSVFRVEATASVAWTARPLTGSSGFFWLAREGELPAPLMGSNLLPLLWMVFQSALMRES